ncbi:MAG: hypothetical protein DSY59_04840 [Persephonella sp.]|nr:MAG: hypothetical protein DSY59_04840 [Persephonella sp.]
MSFEISFFSSFLGSNSDKPNNSSMSSDLKSSSPSCLTSFFSSFLLTSCLTSSFSLLSSPKENSPNILSISSRGISSLNNSSEGGFDGVSVFVSSFYF